MKKIIPVLLLLLFVHNAYSQSKVFKQVGDEISSQISIIKQDNSLVGYLSFTRLEKVSEDSFSYRVSIMDENLNDIGKFDFKEQFLALHDISFEQDVLCLAYLKSNFIGKTYANKKEFRAAKENANTVLCCSL